MKTYRQLKAELCKENPELEGMIQEAYERLRIGELLRAARKDAGMTQAQVAEKMNVNRVQVTQLEGHPQNVTVVSLLKYARALGGDLDISFLGVSKGPVRKIAARKAPTKIVTKKVEGKVGSKRKSPANNHEVHA